MNTFARAIVLSLVGLSTATAIRARDLTFEERVRAQEAIDRVYYSHQIGATKPFEEAVPRSALEAKVTTYLKESVALETLWHTPVTGPMLRRELGSLGFTSSESVRVNTSPGACP